MKKEIKIVIGILIFFLGQGLSQGQPIFSQDSLIVSYLKQSLTVKSDLDYYNLRGATFDILNFTTIATNYDDLENIIGTPIHIYKMKNGHKILFYSISPTFRNDRGGGDLYIFVLDEKNKILKNRGHIFFIETEEDFLYFTNDLMPFESEEGASNCPPFYKN